MNNLRDIYTNVLDNIYKFYSKVYNNPKGKIYIPSFVSIFDSNKEMKYSYRLIRENFFDGQAYGIEVERQDFLNNKLIYVERNEIRKISNTKGKVEGLLNLLSDNKVSPIHLVDVLGSYVDEYVTDFK